MLSACHFSHFPLVWFFLLFTPSMCFALSLQSAFYTQSACYPWSTSLRGGIVWVWDKSFGGGAVFQKKGVGMRRLKFLAASPLVTAPPWNLTRLLHNSASYAGWPPDDWPENQPILPCNFSSVSTWVLRLSFTRYGWLWGSSCFMIRMRKRGSYNLAYLIEHKTQYLQPVSKHSIEKRV